MTNLNTENILKHCIYCNREKSENEFSLEHIWPDSLGGEFLPDLFKTRKVCTRCNNLCGQFVDGAFIKSMFVQNEIASSANSFANPKRPGFLPLSYIGIDKDFPVEQNELCERWIGAAGEHIYHVHEKDEAQWDSYAGGDIIKRKRKDGGRAYLSLTSAEPYWVVVAVSSFKRAFKNAKRCLTTPSDLTPTMPNYDKWLKVFPQPDQNDEKQKRELSYIHSQKNRIIHTGSVLDIGYEERFMCKLALSLGYQILGHDFGVSAYAQELRKALWCKDFQERRELKILGSGSFSTPNEISQGLGQALGICGAWTLTIQALNSLLFAAISSPFQQIRLIVISDDPSLWSDKIKNHYCIGQCYVVAPIIKKAVGPIPLPELITHKYTGQLNVELKKIEKFRVTLETLPPKNVNHGEDSPTE